MGQPNAISTAQMLCSFGLAPSALNVLPLNRVMIEKKPAATVMDNIPIVNIPPFGMCSSLANPTVAAATSAALGVLTPMPCIPNPVGPWLPGAIQTKIGGMAALTMGSTCNCSWGGIIQLLFPGAVQTTSG